MRATTSVAALFGVLALLASASWSVLPASAAVRTSGAPHGQREATHLRGPDEVREVARALNEAERSIGHTIYVDEVGGRVSTDRVFRPLWEGSGYANEIPMPVIAEDANASCGIVVLADPFEGTGSFVPPSLSRRDERYRSGIKSDRLLSGSYDDCLVAAARGIEQGLAPPRTLPLDHPACREPATGRGTSGAVVALFTAGIAAVIGLLGYFLRGERYSGPRGPEKGVGFVVTRREAEALLSTLAPRVMLLAEREAAVVGCLRHLGDGAPHRVSRGQAERLLRQVVPNGFWESFVVAMDAMEKDPEAAQAELRRLSSTVEVALSKLGEAERALRGPRPEEGSGGDENLTRRDGSDA